MKTQTRFFSFRRLSIQQRLPLLICVLLLLTVIVYGLANYYSLRKATLLVGSERLNTITGQMSTSFSQNAEFLLKESNNAAAQSAVIGFITSNGKSFKKETITALNKLHRDSTWVSIQLLGQDLAPVLSADNSVKKMNVDLKEVLLSSGVNADSGKIGKIYKIDDSIYYPIISTVTDKKQIIGYIIAWKTLYASQQAVKQFSDLIGVGASFYIGTPDKTLWTNLTGPLRSAPFKVNNAGELIEFTSPDGKQMMANAQFIPRTNWLMVIAFSEENLLQNVTSFVRWIIAAGMVLTAAGMFAAWLMSRNITKPLKQLTNAATSVTQGNYTLRLSTDVYRGDELAKLADAFNIMAAQVQEMRADLEDKVTERTAQLENVNRELEAFSYSVSHDLRTPLRAISGYSIMLQEDFEPKLNAEGNRMIRNIITNAKMMGQLIDDLLSFSRLGKKDLVQTDIDMQLLATTVVDALLQHEMKNKFNVHINALPPATADQVMIKQVLVNLVSNAIKYSSKKANPEIEIGFKDEGSQTIYYVKDNGVGFNNKYADKLFGVFQRLHSQEEFEGSGVGLSLVKRIIEKHKGEIWAEGLENIGATFYFSLPKN